jgi:uncharacterized protein
MKMEGFRRIEAPRDVVWAALNSPDVLKVCIPGCESIEQVSDTEFKATVTLKIGSIKASFTGKVTLSNLEPPTGYTISGSGSGGAAGFANGTAKVKLEAQDRATLLTYGVEAAVGGKLALGARLLDSTAKKIAGEFFERLDQAIVPGTGLETADGAKRPGWFRSIWNGR